MVWPSSIIACCDTQVPTSAVKTAKNTTETAIRPIGEKILSPPLGKLVRGHAQPGDMAVELGQHFPATAISGCVVR